MQRRPLDVRRIRDIGNWGRASEHIGRHWEEVGVAVLPKHLSKPVLWQRHGYQPSQILPIMANQAIQAELSHLGLPNPDVVLVGSDSEGNAVLQALDFKWAVEFATYRQIRAEALLGLLAADTPHLRWGLTSLAGALDGERMWRDGVLFAPDSPSNHRFLRSVENQRQEYPIEESEVIFEPVDGPTFFAPLPGWPLAIRLAELDRSQGVIQTLEGAEKYYRLGAGLLGAISQVHASIFAGDIPSLEIEEAWRLLREGARAGSTAALVEYVEKTMVLRQQNLARLQVLTTSPYRFADLVSDLAERGIVVPERSEKGKMTPERWRWVELHRRVLAEHRANVVRSARKMMARGRSDAEILSALEHDTRRLAATAKALAQQLIEKSLADERGTVSAVVCGHRAD